MQINVNIGFEQLLQIVKDLPTAQLNQLKHEIEGKNKSKNDDGLEQLLLNGPVATKQVLERLENNRKAIQKWRTS